MEQQETLDPESIKHDLSSVRFEKILLVPYSVTVNGTETKAKMMKPACQKDD